MRREGERKEGEKVLSGLAVLVYLLTEDEALLCDDGWGLPNVFLWAKVPCGALRSRAEQSTTRAGQDMAGAGKVG